MTRALHNSITDIPGLKVGNVADATLCSGVSVVLCERPFVAAVDVRGGGPGTRESDALGLAGTVDEVHALVLSGGSAFGLAAAGGVQAWLADRGVGYAVGGARVPIVPGAVLFDLLNGGNKAWQDQPPYEALGRAACVAAQPTCDAGSVGAGFGATTATLRGGLGTASCALPGGLIVGGAGGGQCGRVGDDWLGAAFLGGGLRARERVRRAWHASAVAAGRARYPAQGDDPGCGRDWIGPEYDDCRCSDQCAPYEARGAPSGCHGTDRTGPGDLPGSYAARRRRRLCGGDGGGRIRSDAGCVGGAWRACGEHAIAGRCSRSVPCGCCSGRLDWSAGVSQRIWRVTRLAGSDCRCVAPGGMLWA